MCHYLLSVVINSLLVLNYSATEAHSKLLLHFIIIKKPSSRLETNLTIIFPARLVDMVQQVSLSGKYFKKDLEVPKNKFCPHTPCKLVQGYADILGNPWVVCCKKVKIPVLTSEFEKKERKKTHYERENTKTW